VRRVIEEALRASASAFIVAHNHPSGRPMPSPADDQTIIHFKTNTGGERLN
jgi:DNA repair protein RadC